MNYKAAILIGLCGAQLSLADSPLPFAWPCSLLDRVVDASRASSPATKAALDILEKVAAGRMDAASPELETMAGLKAGRVHRSDFSSPTVRAYALRKIGEIDLPEALQYLESLRREDFGEDKTWEMWPAARVALFEARLGRITEPSERIAFLEKSLGADSPVDAYAADHLCDGGNYPSLPLIKESIRRHLSQYAEEQVGYCEARMEIVSRNPDRVVAIGSFLKADGRPIDRKLTGWAINQLGAMKSQRADAELERYAKELERVEDSSLDKVEAAYTAGKIRNVLARRAAESSQH
jgi:hypothetical protein